MEESAAFILCIENNAILEQALLLIRSIRTFTGKLRNAEIFAIAPRAKLGVNKDIQAVLNSFGVTYHEAPLNWCCPEYGSANRLYAAAWAAEHTSVTTLVVLDSDTLFFDEPELLGSSFDVAVRPVDVKGSTSIGPKDEFEPYWLALSQLAGLPIDRLPFVETTMEKTKVRASYNGGYAVVRRNTGIMQRAAEIFTRSVNLDLRPFKGRPDFRVFASTGFVSNLASEFWGSNQAAFSVATWSMTTRVKILDGRYNVPLHLLAQVKDRQSEWFDIAPIHVHYHWMFNSEHRAIALKELRTLGVATDSLDWLSAHLLTQRSE